MGNSPATTAGKNPRENTIYVYVSIYIYRIYGVMWWMLFSIAWRAELQFCTAAPHWSNHIIAYIIYTRRERAGP